MKVIKFFDSIAFRISLSIAIVVAASTMTVGWLILQEAVVSSAKMAL